jgi:hypothetical protein
MSKTTEQRVIVEDDSSVDEITREMATLKFRQDPYPMYARMRRKHPVYRSSRGIWYLIPTPTSTLPCATCACQRT